MNSRIKLAFTSAGKWAAVLSGGYAYGGIIAHISWGDYISENQIIEKSLLGITLFTFSFVILFVKCFIQRKDALISGGLIPRHLWHMIEITNFSPRRGSTENTPSACGGAIYWTFLLDSLLIKSSVMSKKR